MIVWETGLQFNDPFMTEFVLRMLTIHVLHYSVFSSNVDRSLWFISNFQCYAYQINFKIVASFWSCDRVITSRVLASWPTMDKSFSFLLSFWLIRTLWRFSSEKNSLEIHRSRLTRPKCKKLNRFFITTSTGSIKQEGVKQRFSSNSQSATYSKYSVYDCTYVHKIQ